MKLKMLLILLFGISVLITGCDETGYKKYQEVLRQELSEGKRSDSLFMGIRFGMTSKDFYLHCWDQNKKGLFTDGAGNTAVLYKLRDELKYPASMNFYPEFNDGRISKIGASFKYDGWAPWNKHMVADSLKYDVLRLYQKWYHDGQPFIKIEDEKRGTIYVKVDGNRRIIIGSYDETYVKVDYTDLLTEEKLEE